MINFTANIRPVGKARARVTRYGSYTPQKTKDFEQAIGWEFKRSYPNHQIIVSPIKLTVVACFTVPKSYTNKKTVKCLSGEIRHIVKPDIDNIAKGVMDALNGLAYKDDNLVCELIVSKIYGERDYVSIVIDNVV